MRAARAAVARIKQLRLQREDFEVLKIIGRGAFGEVRAHAHSYLSSYRRRRLALVSPLTSHMVALVTSPHEPLATSSQFSSFFWPLSSAARAACLPACFQVSLMS